MPHNIRLIEVVEYSILFQIEYIFCDALILFEYATYRR